MMTEEWYKIKDINLAEEGLKEIRLAESVMPVMRHLKEIYRNTKPLIGYTIAGCLHVTKETAVLLWTLKSAGANMAWAGCNPLSTQDTVAASLVAHHKIPVFAWRGISNEEYYQCLDDVLKVKPHITIDDGADLVMRVHEQQPHLLEGVIGGTEETTKGVHRLRMMEQAGELKYPIMAVNDAETKWDFDNFYGTGQSTLEGISRATHVLYAGKDFVVAGYGKCGKGVATRAKGMGANVIVTEVDDIRALKAKMDGFRVMTMDDAASIGDIFVTATSCKDVITDKHYTKMKHGAILANTGHFDNELNIGALENLTKDKKEIRPNNVAYTLKNGRTIHVLAEGRLVNLAAAEGHPPEVMDMSFANQFMSILHLVNEHKQNGIMAPRVHNVSREQDQTIARIKLTSKGVTIDTLTEEQERYLNDYLCGT